jgi:dTDP-glucose pyrophosphorylase
MHRHELSKFVVRPDQTVRDAMRVITDNWRELALLADQDLHVIGVITDGDIRRGLLKGLTLESPAASVMTRDFVAVGPNADRAAVLDLMKARTIRHVPVLDGERRLVGIHFLEALIGTTDKPNLAVIMAGGEGRRLRPLTDSRPKPMMEVAGRPILERIVLHLVGYGIKRIFISVNYLAEMIRNHFGSGEDFGCSIEYLHEDHPLGSGGALSLLPRDVVHPFLVMNGDLVSQFDVSRMLEHHTREAAAATIAARHHQVDIPFGVLELRDGRLGALSEKPSAHFLINAGIYVLQPALLDLIPSNRFYPITSLFERLLMEEQKVAVYRIEEDWIDVGRREDLSRANGLD